LKRMVISSAAQQAADVLAEDILSNESDQDEWLLGSENDLMNLLGVGRPTIRQAARLLEQQQLLVVRRGLRGGFFGRRPTHAGVTAATRLYLRAHHTTFGQLLEAVIVLAPAYAALAAKSDDSALRGSLSSFYRVRDVFEEQEPSVRRFMELSPLFHKEVATVAGSPTLNLFAGALMDLASSSAAIAHMYGDLDRRRLTVRNHEAVAIAIAEGRPDLAAQRMHQHLDLIWRWTDSTILHEPL